MTAKKLLLAQFDLHNVLFSNVIADITDVESNKFLVPPMNNVKWLAGHLLWVETGYSRLTGSPVKAPWADHFLSIEGATEEDYNAPKTELPTLQQIKDKWNELCPKVRTGIENLPDEALDTVIEFNHPIAPFDNTLGGFLLFLNHHQAYHIGQISILRRGLGKERMYSFQVKE